VAFSRSRYLSLLASSAFTPPYLSVDGALERWLLARPTRFDHRWVLFKHGAGEIADYLVLEVSTKPVRVKLELWHAKGAGGAPSVRVGDLQVLLAQAIKSRRWATDRGLWVELGARLSGQKAPRLTVTGTARLNSVISLNDKMPDEVLRIAAVAEQFSEHPLGRAIVAAARQCGLAIPEADDFVALPGYGVRARVAHQIVEVLSPRSLDGDPPHGATVLEDDGATGVIVVLNGLPVGVLGLDDTVREGTVDVVAKITAVTSLPPVLLTGDNHRAGTRLGAQVGIVDIHADLLPDDKVAAVRQLQASGHRVLFVGDGINDAPAMAAAHTSIAMGRNGADLTLQTADAVTVRDELATIPAAVELARRARRIVIANLVIAATFITGLVAWDLFGHLPLPLGVAGHEGSTIIVALNGLRLLSIDPPMNRWIEA
jgi:hypothetical protein